MKKTTLLKKLIRDPEILIMPGVYDALSAKVAERCGVKAVQASGYGLVASYMAMPDVGILTLTQMADLTRRICDAVDIPVMADGDTGFGNQPLLRRQRIRGSRRGRNQLGGSAVSKTLRPYGRKTDRQHGRGCQKNRSSCGSKE